MTGPVLIGLTGGIGSGKSTVAGLFAELGCVVVDSDALSREALEREEVKETLRSWWGAGVIDAAGRVDRGAVARIVFSDPNERTRLEGLIHPLIELERAKRVEDARNAGVRAVIIDAPLLLEAGLDSEVDAVVFVDSPLETRVERVLSGRGWDEAELDRREKTQMPLEQKRKRSDYLVVNNGSLEDLRPQVAEILTRIIEKTDGD